MCSVASSVGCSARLAMVAVSEARRGVRGGSVREAVLRRWVARVVKGGLGVVIVVVGLLVCGRLRVGVVLWKFVVFCTHPIVTDN